MLATAADRVRKLKASGKSLEESIAAKPFTDLDADWAGGRYKGDDFVRIVYLDALAPHLGAASGAAAPLIRVHVATAS